MRGGHICAAGLDRDGRQVRPVLPYDRMTKELVGDYGGPFAIGAVVDIGETVPRPISPEVRITSSIQAAPVESASLTKPSSGRSSAISRWDRLSTSSATPWIAMVARRRCRHGPASRRSACIDPRAARHSTAVSGGCESS